MQKYMNQIPGSEIILEVCTPWAWGRWRCDFYTRIRLSASHGYPCPTRKLRVPGAKKLMLDTRKYKIFALFMWKLELPVIWDFPYSCRLSSQSQSSLLRMWWSRYLWLHYCVVDIFFVLVESDESRFRDPSVLFFAPFFAYFAITVVYLFIWQSTVVLLGSSVLFCFASLPLFLQFIGEFLFMCRVCCETQFVWANYQLCTHVLLYVLV